MKEFDKLPKEYFTLLQKGMPEFNRSQLWLCLLINVIFGFVYNPGLAIEIPIVQLVTNIFLVIMLLWIIPCIFFSTKDTLMRHKPAYIVLNIIGVSLFRITFLHMLTLLSATMYCNSWERPNPIVVYIMYGIACLVLLEELVVNLLAWKHTKRYIIAGEFKVDGNGFFGKYNKRVKKFWTVVTSVSSTLMPISLICIPLSRILSSFGIYIDGNEWFMPIIGLFFVAYHVLLYIFAYVNSKLLAQFYYVKRFEQNTPEFKADKEYGIGFFFTRLILAVILICVICVLAVVIGQKSMGLR